MDVRALRPLLARAVVGVVLTAHVAAAGLATALATASASGPGDPLPRAAVAPGDPLASPEPSLPLLRPSPTPSASPSSRPGSTPSPAPSRVVPPQHRWALIVGITDYRSPVRDTVAGARDARVVRDTLLRAGWRSDHIRILTEGAATGKALQDGLTWLIARSSPSTFAVFHYSGHVKQRNGHEYLWPVDNAFYSDTSLVTAMKRVRGSSWTSISGCEAGGFNDGLAARSRLFTASSDVYEKSYEYPEWDMSVWTGVLWDQALRRKNGDRDRDGHVTVQEAFTWGAPRAAHITKNQRPHGPQHPEMAGGSGALRLDAPVAG